MNENDSLHEIFKRQGLKNTKHRIAIIGILEKSAQPLTADDLFVKLKDTGISISLSTVYRVLEALVSKGLIIKSVFAENNKSVFEVNRMEHKHYLVCIGCQQMISIEGCPLAEYEKTLESKKGFAITGHKLEVYGYCPNCQVVE